MDGTEGAFLAAILDAPRDDALRLVYADWLEEHGDPRAEFIRLQVTASRTPHWDPRWSGWRAREQALLDQYGARWRPEEIGGLRWGAFLRGFVEEVRPLEIARLTGLPAAQRLAPISTVTIKHHNLDDEGAASLAQVAELAAIRSLDLSVNRIGVDGARALADSPHLAQLEELDLWGNLLAGVEPLTFRPEQWQNLRKLQLGYNELRDTGAQTLAQSESLTSLVHLDLSQNRLGDGGAEALARVHAPLTILELRYNGIGRVGVSSLAGGNLRSQLRHLSLAGNPLTSNGVELLARRPWPELRSLNLTGVEAPDALHLATAGSFRQLERLDLSGNQLASDRGVTASPQESGCPNLRALLLSSCQLNDQFLIALAKSRLLANVEQLDLSFNQVSGVGLRALVDSPFSGRIRTLSLRSNRLAGRDAGLLVGEGLPNLVSLDVRYNGVANEVREQLAARLGTGLLA